MRWSLFVACCVLRIVRCVRLVVRLSLFVGACWLCVDSRLLCVRYVLVS